MDQYFFSIIVPVYNVRDYLQSCIDSILIQDYSSYEIILVDDGSTDDGGEICDNYSERYDNIRTVHKDNGGLSSARNAGLKVAKGKYLLFVDSDDYIEKESLIKISDFLLKHEVDVLFLERINVFPNGKRAKCYNDYNKIKWSSKDDVLKGLSKMEKFPVSACVKAYNREMIEENGISFELDLINEDIDWTLKVLSVSNRFGYCPSTYYCYRHGRSGSISNISNIKNIESSLYILKKWTILDPNTILHQCIDACMAYTFVMTLVEGCKVKVNVKGNLYFKQLDDYKWIVKYGNNNTCKIVNILIRIIGVRNTAKLLTLYKDSKELSEEIHEKNIIFNRKYGRRRSGTCTSKFSP